MDLFLISFDGHFSDTRQRQWQRQGQGQRQRQRSTIYRHLSAMKGNIQ